LGMFRDELYVLHALISEWSSALSEVYSQDEGEECPSLAASLIGERERHGLSDSESAWLCATILYVILFSLLH
jgi:hypothetical protein